MTNRDDELKELISQIIGDYFTYQSMGYTDEQCLESTIEYDSPNLEAWSNRRTAKELEYVNDLLGHSDDSDVIHHLLSRIAQLKQEKAKDE